MEIIEIALVSDSYHKAVNYLNNIGAVKIRPATYLLDNQYVYHIIAHNTRVFRPFYHEIIYLFPERYLKALEISTKLCIGKPDDKS